jgi:hypothetical protein
LSKPGTVVTPSIAFAGGVVSVKNAALITFRKLSAGHRLGFQRSAVELGSVVDSDPLGQRTMLAQALEIADHLGSTDRRVGFQEKALSAVLVHRCQDPKSASIHQSITHEIHAPALIGSIHRRADDSSPARYLLPLSDPQTLIASPSVSRTAIA